MLYTIFPYLRRLKTLDADWRYMFCIKIKFYVVCIYWTIIKIFDTENVVKDFAAGILSENVEHGCMLNDSTA